MVAKLFSVVGRPGTDVGIFARLLSARLRAAETLSVRVAAAAEVSHGTHLGNQIAQRDAEQEGCLLPSAIVAPLVQHRLQRAQISGGTCVLSAFPRTNDQLRMLQHAGLGTPQVLHLVLSREDAEHRSAERRVCVSTGEPMYPVLAVAGAPGGVYEYLVESECDSPMPVRDPADSQPVLARRLDAFDEQTAPLLDQLRSRGAVQDIPLGETAEDTWEAILAACGLPPERPTTDD